MTPLAFSERNVSSYTWRPLKSFDFKIIWDGHGKELFLLFQKMDFVGFVRVKIIVRKLAPTWVRLLKLRSVNRRKMLLVLISLLLNRLILFFKQITTSTFTVGKRIEGTVWNHFFTTKASRMLFLFVLRRARLEGKNEHIFKLTLTSEFVMQSYSLSTSLRVFFPFCHHMQELPKQLNGPARLFFPPLTRKENGAAWLLHDVH